MHQRLLETLRNESVEDNYMYVNIAIYDNFNY